MNTLKSLICALGATGLLVACGGGGGDGSDAASSPSATTVPADALANSDGFTAFVAGLAADDGSEPIAMDAIDLPPTSETAEPMSLG